MSTTLQQTINWAQTFVQYAPLTAGVGNELAISIANETVSTITAAPFTWPWNRAEYTELVLEEGVQDYTVPLANFGFLEKVTLITADGKYAYEIKDVYNTLPLGVSISDYAEPKAVSVGLAPGLDSNAGAGFGYGYSTSIDTATIAQNSYDSASLLGVGSVVANLIAQQPPSQNTGATSNSCLAALPTTLHVNAATHNIQVGELMIVVVYLTDATVYPSGIAISDPNNNIWNAFAPATTYTSASGQKKFVQFFWATSNQIISSNPYIVTVTGSPSTVGGEISLTAWRFVGSPISYSSPVVIPSGTFSMPLSLVTSGNSVVLALTGAPLIDGSFGSPVSDDFYFAYFGEPAEQFSYQNPQGTYTAPAGTYNPTFTLDSSFGNQGGVGMLASFNIL